MKEYNFSAIESKWQKYWDEHKTFEASNDFSKKKFYGLVEFPYPSGHGMHVGHIKAYSGLEVVSRKRRMQGYNVLFPIGFDAYGLPTENTAIKTGVHPRKVTDDNIKKFTGQLKRVGFHSIGQELLIRPMKTTISGHSGYSLKCLRMVLYSEIRPS